MKRERMRGAIVLTAALVMLSLRAGHVGGAETTNVVLIVSDDQGYNDLGCLNPAILTPSLDRLCREGTRLTSFYVAWPACTPSRAAFLSGRYPQRNGMSDMIRNEAPDFGRLYRPGDYEVTFERIGGMDTREVLLPMMLKKTGYQTAVFGKWDLGSLQRFLPASRGFDDFYGFVNTGIDYFTHERYGVPSMYRDRRPTSEGKGICSTKLFADESVRFIDEHHQEPFFLYVPFNAPHNASNLDPNIRGGAQASEEFLARYPELQQKAGLTEGTKYGRPAKVPDRTMRQLRYRAAVTEMDAGIGRILERLDRYSLADRTLVIFFSDNGGSGGADNAPLRGRKAQMWEGGLRVPCVVRLPGVVPAGAVNDSFLSSLEILPTICSVTGTDIPTEIVTDGFDMLPALRGHSESERTSMFWKRRDHKAARVGDWKWVDAANGGGLFHLAEDIGESNDLSSRFPDRLARLQQAFAAWEEEMAAAEPRGPFRDY